MPRAIAFEPEENVEKFLRDFVLEESPLDVRDVRAAVGAYRETQAMLRSQEDEAERLREVCGRHGELEVAREEMVTFRHVERRLMRDQAGEQRTRAQAELDSLRQGQESDRAALAEIDGRLDELGRVIAATRLEVQGDPKAVELDKLKRERADLAERIERLEEARRSLREQLGAARLRWMTWLKRGDDLVRRDAACGPLAEILRIDPALIERLVDPDDAVGRAALDDLAEKFAGIWGDAADVMKTVRRNRDERLGRLQQLAEDLERLGRN